MPKQKKHKREGLPKYVYRKRLGVLYFQRQGEPAVKFECQDHNDPEFMMEYALLLTGKKQRLMKPARKRDMAHLIDHYVKSSKYIDLAPSTAQGYDEVLKYLKAEFGQTPVSDWDTPAVIMMQEGNKERHHFSNYCVVVSRILFKEAIRLGWINYNPAQGVELTKSKNPPRRPWPYDKINQFKDVATGRELLLFEMLLATGQRIQDVLDMKWIDIRPIDGTVGVELVQNKTGKPLWIPLRDSLVTLLSNTKRVNDYIITNRYGRGKWSYRGAHQAVQKIRKQIGAEEFDIHCLRYSAACDLALAGMDDETIGAVTGQCMATVQHYTKSVRQMANAKRAIAARESMLLKNRA